MEAQEFSAKLQEIADGIEKIATTLEESEYAEGEAREKVASQQKLASRSRDFDLGEISSRPGKGSNPLLDFCLS